MKPYIKLAGGHRSVADVAADSGAGSDKGFSLEGAQLPGDRSQASNLPSYNQRVR